MVKHVERIEVDTPEQKFNNPLHGSLQMTSRFSEEQELAEWPVGYACPCDGFWSVYFGMIGVTFGFAALGDAPQRGTWTGVTQSPQR
jgi:hypothetical protein